MMRCNYSWVTIDAVEHLRCVKRAQHHGMHIHDKQSCDGNCNCEVGTE